MKIEKHEDYFHRLADKADRWLFVPSHPDDNTWCGDWIVDDIGCFLVTMLEQYDHFKEPGRGNKNVYKHVKNGKYHIVCQGNDDLMMHQWDLPLNVANEIMDLLSTGTVSRVELEGMGFKYE